MKVAIVGNGPNVLNRALGPSIDRCDVVVRINCFRLKGYERDVGSRTTHWSLGVNRWLVDQLQASGRPKFIDTLSGIWLKPDTDDSDPAQRQRLVDFLELPKDIVIHCPILFDNMAEKLLRCRPTQGLLSILIAAHLYPKAKIQTAGIGSRWRDGYGHYFNPAQRSWSGHSFRRERALLESWHHEGLIHCLDY